MGLARLICRRDLTACEDRVHGPLVYIAVVETRKSFKRGRNVGTELPPNIDYKSDLYW
jgi:hypothetical protein